MGIQNKDGALYFATGVDNTGLYSGRREAIGIIKAMAGEITSFDVFGGIGVSASIAFAKAAKGAYDFEKQFQQSMKEVATLSSGIKGSLTDFMNQVVDITREIPVQANDAAKALYQIVSAGHDGADGMKILEVSAKAAIGGVTDTATAADAITTLLNAYKLNVSEAENLSDQLFTTVRLGKTSFGQLGQSIAQVAPVAAAYGVEVDQVLAAVATLTKQGTPTAQAMTQIRAAIVGVSKYLGDGAFNGRTFQEALEKVRQEAGGSEAKLREFIPEMEAVNGLLGLTGQNAEEAAGHLGEMENATGAAEAAFKEMVSSAENQLQLLQNNITAALRPMGESILKEVSSIATAFNKAFENGDVQESMKTLGALIVTVTSAFVGYKGSILAVSSAKQAYAIIIDIINKQRTIEIGRLTLSQGFYDAETAAVVKNTSSRILLTKALKAQFVASLKATAAMISNPYILAAAAVAGLGYALYKVATAETVAETATRKHNEEQERFRNNLDERKKKIEELIRIIQDETETEYAKAKAYEELQRISPALTVAYSQQELATISLANATKKVNEEIDRVNYDNIISQVNKYKRLLNEVMNANGDWSRLSKKANEEIISEFGAGMLSNKEIQLQKNIDLYKQYLSEYSRLKKEAEENAKPVEVKLLEAKSSRDEIVQEFAAAKFTLEEEQRKIKESGFGIIPIDVQLRFDNAKDQLSNIDKIIAALMGNSNSSQITYKEAYNTAKKEWEAAQKALEESKKKSKADYDKAKKDLDEKEIFFKDLGGITSSSKIESAAEKLRKETEQYNLLINKQALEQKRAEEDLQTQAAQTKINAMKEGNARTLEQMKLEHKKELQLLDRQREDLLRKRIDDERVRFESNPLNKGKSFSNVYNEALKIKNTGDEMVSLFGGGNVDLLARPMIDAAKLVEKGWKDAGEGIATVFSSSYEVEQDGKNVMIQVTPILPDGSVLSQNELETYIDTRLNGVKNVLEADDKGIVIHVDMDVSPEKSEQFGEKLHQYQEAFYDGIQKMSKKGIDMNNLFSSQSENKSFELIKTDTLTKQANDITNFYKSVQDKYQNFNQQRLNLEKQYQDDETVLLQKMLNAKTDAERKQIAEMMRELNKQRDKGLSELAVSIIKESGIWNSLYENLDKKSTKTIKDLTNKAKVMINLNSDNLSESDRKALYEKLDEMYDKLIERNPFQATAESIRELNEAIASSDMDAMYSATEKVNRSLKVSVDYVNSIVGNIGSMFGSKGSDMASDIVVSLSSGLDIYGGMMDILNGDMLKGMDKLTSGISKLSEAAEGDWIWEKNRKEHDDAMEELTKKKLEQQLLYNKALMEQNLLFEEGSTIFGDDAYSKAKNATELYKKTTDEARDAVSKLGGVEIVTDHKAGKGKQILNKNKAKDVYDNILKVYPELIDSNGKLNIELAKSIVNTRGMTDANKALLNSAIDLSEALQEEEQVMKDYLTDIFGELGGSMSDALVDAFKNGSDAAKSFTDSVSDMLETLAKQMIYSVTLAPIIAKAQEQMLAITKDTTLSDGQKFEQYTGILDNLIDEAIDQQGHANDLYEFYQKKAAEKGYEIFKPDSGSSQDSTKKGFATMSQDTGEELNGRFTALQIAGEEIKNQSILQTGIQGDMQRRLEEIYKFNAESYSEYSDMMLSVIDFLEGIHKNTNCLPRMEKMLEEIKRYSASLAGK